jgi:uncharacterized tellurite resistance protein B-like protein
MSKEKNDLIVSTLDKIFDKNEQLTKDKQKFQEKIGVSVQELELALTVLLVDLASCDQNFDQDEYQIISQGLMRVFGTSKEGISKLVNQANLVIANLRGTTKFAELLRDNLDNEKKASVMEIIDEIIAADGVEDGFETYLRSKLSGILGIE